MDDFAVNVEIRLGFNICHVLVKVEFGVTGWGMNQSQRFVLSFGLSQHVHVHVCACTHTYIHTHVYMCVTPNIWSGSQDYLYLA